MIRILLFILIVPALAGCGNRPVQQEPVYHYNSRTVQQEIPGNAAVLQGGIIKSTDPLLPDGFAYITSIDGEPLRDIDDGGTWGYWGIDNPRGAKWVHVAAGKRRIGIGWRLMALRQRSFYYDLHIVPGQRYTLEGVARKQALWSSPVIDLIIRDGHGGIAANLGTFRG